MPLRLRATRAAATFLTKRFGLLGQRVGERLVASVDLSKLMADEVNLWVEGVSFRLDLRDNLQRVAFLTGSYERPLFSHIRRALQPGDVVIDVGANIGIHALPLANRLSVMGGTVYAFEAAPDTAETLVAGAQRNNLANVQVLPFGLGATEGVKALRNSSQYGPRDVGSRTMIGDGDVQFEVPVRRFDDWAESVQLQRMDVLKIDVEGSELDVLLGMIDALNRFKPRLVAIEIVDNRLEIKGQSREQLRDLLESAGYVASPPSVFHRLRGEHQRRFGPNFIFQRLS